MPPICTDCETDLYGHPKIGVLNLDTGEIEPHCFYCAKEKVYGLAPAIEEEYQREWDEHTARRREAERPHQEYEAQRAAHAQALRQHQAERYRYLDSIKPRQHKWIAILGWVFGWIFVLGGMIGLVTRAAFFVKGALVAFVPLAIGWIIWEIRQAGYKTKVAAYDKDHPAPEFTTPPPPRQAYEPPPKTLPERWVRLHRPLPHDGSTLPLRPNEKYQPHIQRRDGRTCQKCGYIYDRQDPRLFEVHHIIPKARGGQDDPTNLITLCRPCHIAETWYGHYHVARDELEDYIPDEPGTYDLREPRTESRSIHRSRKIGRYAR